MVEVLNRELARIPCAFVICSVLQNISLFIVIVRLNGAVKGSK